MLKHSHADNSQRKQRFFFIILLYVRFGQKKSTSPSVTRQKDPFHTNAENMQNVIQDKKQEEKESVHSSHPCGKFCMRTNKPETFWAPEICRIRWNVSLVYRNERPKG